ncbi:MAG: DUF2264 domain-containing protein [Rikenellaceae bacterium]|nr:DUF2264 domain-containing protein [Rikenellaceae bacterium]
MRKFAAGAFIALLCLVAHADEAAAQRRNQQPQQPTDREYWVEQLCLIAEPVLSRMSRGELQRTMIVEYSPTWDGRDARVAYMEAFGRLMAGIAPWLALPDDDTPEGVRRKQIRDWALASYAHSVDPESADYLLWTGPQQRLVDAAYIAQSFIHARQALWEPLDEKTKQRYIEKFQSLRAVVAPYNNWLLFRAIVDSFLLMIGEQHDAFAIDLTVRKIGEWYLSDGWYSDGSEFALDYYNSFVIHPMLLDVVEILAANRRRTPVDPDLALRRMQRYNILLERMISPEATFPLLGRSIHYRMGVFQTLALSAWKYGLPEPLTNGQVRNALTAVMKRMFSVEGNFTEQGFLSLGLVGYQPDIADYYTNTGSEYITATVFLPLGLPADHDFWTAEPQEWTTQRAWSGKPFPRDYHTSVRR